MPGPKQGSKALKILENLRAQLKRSDELVCQVIAFLEPVDLRGENIDPGDRSKLGFKPKRPKR